MKSRFKKAWCERCKFMVFIGECPHARSIAPGIGTRLSALWQEKGVGAALKVFGSMTALLGHPPGIKP